VYPVVAEDLACFHDDRIVLWAKNFRGSDAVQGANFA